MLMIFDPITGAGTLGGAVPVGTKRKFVKCTAYNGTGATVSIKINLVSSGGATMTYVDYDLAPRETYLCPEVVGASLGPGGTLQTVGAGITFSAVASDTLNN